MNTKRFNNAHGFSFFFQVREVNTTRVTISPETLCAESGGTARVGTVNDNST